MKYGGVIMQIKFIEIQNFKKLKSCRIEFENKTSLFVGANNSGKTSAMEALVKFLIRKNSFTTNDFTLSDWIEINKIGEEWINNIEVTSDIFKNQLETFLPSMDVWLQIEENEIHYVTHLIPTLNWTGGLLGVRLRLEPKNLENLYNDYRTSRESAKDTIATAKQTQVENPISLELWPRDMRDFLNKKIRTHFIIRAYTLDPLKTSTAADRIPQELGPYMEPLDRDPFEGLILIHSINAQRGFSDSNDKTDSLDEDGSNDGVTGNLSSQLRAYYNTHLDPSKSPDTTDIEALGAIETAQKSFDQKLSEGFKDSLSELQSLGYPGFSDPRITISTKIKPMDGLDHNSAVQFELMSEGSDNNRYLKLPEQYNGLGYQNLISMIFKLIRFRDEWMRVGKVEKKVEIGKNESFIPPLQLVLIEEPEAHLHAQVQQVFIRKAYDVLRNHKDLKGTSSLKTQLVVSTHSSHVAHEMPFECLRYFRRKSTNNSNEVPTTTVVNLSEVFGTANETERFVTRYLKSTHCDLFFADAAILIEGSAERMLLPQFINKESPKLNESYISLLEIGGSHAHRLKPLIEHLGLTSLIITDLDSVNPEKNYSSVQPRRNQGFTTGNSTLKDWVPQKNKIEDLLDLKPNEKVMKYIDSYSIRVAYQIPVKVKIKDKMEEALSTTFEDALVFENLALFKNLKGIGLIAKFKVAINEESTVSGLEDKFFNILGGSSAKKAEFALDIFLMEDIHELETPTYIKEGLSWLERELKVEQSDFLDQSPNLSEAIKREGV